MIRDGSQGHWFGNDSLLFVLLINRLLAAGQIGDLDGLFRA
jgi:hypothetical protein